MTALAIKIFIGLLPLFLFKQLMPSFAQGMFFVFGSFFLFLLSLSEKPVREFRNKYLSYIFIWLFICVFFKFTSNPNQEWFNFWASSAGFIYVLAGALLFLTVYKYVDKVENFLTPILFVCVINFILVICQFFHYDFMWYQAPGIMGFFSSINQLSQYSAMSLPILYFINPFLAVIPFFLVIITGAFIQQALSGYFAVLAGFFFLLWQKQIKKATAVLFLVFFICMLMITYDHAMFNLKSRFTISRLPCWKTAINLILKKPFLGYGYQSYVETVRGKDVSVGYYDEKVNPGSDWLHNGMEFGVPILILIGLFLKDLWARFKTCHKDKLTYLLAGSLVITLSNMLWQNMIRYAAIGGTFIIILTFLMIKLNEVRYGND